MHTSSRRLGAAVAATALSAGALVTMAAPAANAATIDTTYTCNFPGLGANGKTVLTIKPKALKTGKNKVKLSYAGDDFTAAGKSKVVVTVTR